MHGLTVTYKVRTLKISPARPDYTARVERERANLPLKTLVDPDEEANRVREEKAARKLEQKLAKFHARKRRIEGYKSSNMEPMTVKKFKSRQGVNEPINLTMMSHKNHLIALEFRPELQEFKSTLLSTVQPSKTAKPKF